MKLVTEAFRTVKAEITQFSPVQALLFLPGVFFVVLGLVAAIAPQMITLLLAVLFVFIGMLLLLGTYKVLVVKSRVEEALRDFQGRIFIQSVDLDAFEDDDEGAEGKKIVYH